MPALTLASATVASDGKTIDAVFTGGNSGNINNVAFFGFSVKANGGAVKVTSAARQTTLTARLYLDRIIEPGESVIVAYAPGNVTDGGGTPVSASFSSGVAATNSSTARDTATLNQADYENIAKAVAEELKSQFPNLRRVR